MYMSQLMRDGDYVAESLNEIELIITAHHASIASSHRTVTVAVAPVPPTQHSNASITATDTPLSQLNPFRSGLPAPLHLPPFSPYPLHVAISPNLIRCIANHLFGTVW